MISIITQRDVIRTVPNGFEAQYGHDRRRWGKVIDALNALDVETCSASDITAIIGNDGWTSLYCEECDARAEALVRIGDEPDYQACWIDLCPACVAVAAVKATEIKAENMR